MVVRHGIFPNNENCISEENGSLLLILFLVEKSLANISFLLVCVSVQLKNMKK
jgi:hypothetical protein